MREVFLRYLLDTNIISYWMRGDKSVLEKIQTYNPCDMLISSVSLAEILYGIEKSPVRKKERRKKIDAICSLLEILPFDKSATETYAVIRAYLEKQGSPISERDTQIAAIALANNLCVVTHNTKEFERVPELKTEDWAEH